MIRIFLVLIALTASCCAGYLCSINRTPHAKQKILDLSPTTVFFPPTLPLQIEKKPYILYPWERSHRGKVSPISKEYFRCKGSPIHPPIPIVQEGKVVENIFDCRGADCHSLPIRHHQEYIYPILLELLNEIQCATGKPVIITSGHRCPIHNTYVDRSPKNQTSKHQMGAEVSFYVTELQNNPEAVLGAIFAYYAAHPKYASERKNYAHFERYDRESDTTTKPWINKEIFIKYYTAHEGRNSDNRHPYPYFSIQVRFDPDTNMRVVYSPQEAQSYYHK